MVIRRRHKFVTLLGLSAVCLSLLLLSSDRGISQSPNSTQNIVVPSEVIAALKDPNPQVRLQAAETLYQTGIQKEAAIAVIMSILKDLNPEVRIRAAETLYRMNVQKETALSVIIAALKDPNPQVRRLAVRRLEMSRGTQIEGVIPALIVALKDSDLTVRLAATTMIAEFGPQAEAAIPALLFALKDPVVDIRFEAAKALVSTGTAAKAAIPDLIRALDDSEADGAVYALTGICSALKVVPPELIATLRQSNTAARVQSAIVLGELGALASIAAPELTIALQDSSLYVRFYAATALGKIGKPANAAILALTRLLKDPYEGMRVAAASALWDVGAKPEVVLPTLIAGVKARYADSPTKPGDAETTRLSAVSTLGKMGVVAKAAIPALTVALKDKDGQIQLAAARSLAKIRGAQDGDVSLLLVNLKYSSADEEQEDSREQTISKLARLGEKAKPAVPMLLTILKQDPNSRIRRLVPFALVAISPNDKTVLAALITALKDRDEEVRASTAYALGEIEPAAKAAVPNLVAALKARPVDRQPNLDSVPIAVALINIGAAQDVAVPVLAAAFTDGTCNVYYGLCTNAARALRKAGSDTKTASSALVKLLPRVEAYDQVGIALTLLDLGAEIEPATTALVAIANRTEKSLIRSSDAKAEWNGSDRRYLAYRMAEMVERLQKNPDRLSTAEMAATVASLEQVLQVLATPKEPKVSDATLERIRRSLSALKAPKGL
ncbi:MAG TPA: HEAT repeat domain-containing protein [Candidatus Sericytochromatia bacterium]